MSSNGGESVGDFFVKLFFDVDSKSQKDTEGVLDGMKNKFHDLAKSAFAFNEIREAVNYLLEPMHQLYESVVKVAETADTLNNLAVSLGTTTGALERMRFVAHLADVDIGTTDFALNMLNRQMGEAATGGAKEVTKAFHKLGVTMKDAHGKVRDVGEVMPELVLKFSEMKDASARASLAQDIFGRSSRQLLPLLSKQAEELKAMNAEFDALGGAYSQDLIQRSAVFSDNIKLTNFAFNNMKRDLATGIIPELNKFFDIWLGFVKQNWPEISSTLKELGDTIGKVFMETAGTAFDSFLKYMRDISKNPEAIKQITSILKDLGVVIGIYFALKNPGMVGLAAIAGIIEDIMGAMAGKDSLIGRFTLKMKEFLDTFKPMKDAVNWLTTDHIGNKMGWNTDLPGGKDVGMFEDGSTTMDYASQQRNIEKQKLIERYPEVSKENEQRGIAQRVISQNSDKSIADLKELVEGIVGAPMKQWKYDRSNSPDVDPLDAALDKGIAKYSKTVNIHVKADGTDAKKIAHEIRKVVKEEVSGQVGGAYNDLVSDGD